MEVSTKPTPMRPKRAKTALLGMEVGGVTPTPGSGRPLLRVWRRVFGARLLKVLGVGKGLRLRREEMCVESVERRVLSGRGAISAVEDRCL